MPTFLQAEDIPMVSHDAVYIQDFEYRYTWYEENKDRNSTVGLTSGIVHFLSRHKYYMHYIVTFIADP